MTTIDAKQAFLETYDREHAITMKVLRAYPEDELDLRPHPKCRSARELGWVFVLERGLGEMVAATPPEELERKVRFFTAPQTLGELSRMDWLWLLLHDEIHHRGQFSVYLRMADARVPSIYGPTADEEWM